nr:MAG TPA: hypothetical protein [Caudoviricetes sp.]
MPRYKNRNSPPPGKLRTVSHNQQVFPLVNPFYHRGNLKSIEMRFLL